MFKNSENNAYILKNAYNNILNKHSLTKKYLVCFKQFYS